MDKKNGFSETLSSVKSEDLVEERLQRWDSEAKKLLFVCGDRNNACEVWIGQGEEEAKKLSPTRPIISKLTTKSVDKALAARSSPPDGSSLLKTLHRVLTQYVHFYDPRVPWLMAVWIMASYLYSCFSHFGYLFLFSDKPRCGKSRILELLSHLAYEATKLLNAPTGPALRDLLSAGRTVLCDTLERWRDKDQHTYGMLMEILDAGFKKNGTAVKQVPMGDGNWRVEEFPVYSPLAMAGIGITALTDTAQDRSFMIEMKRKSTSVKTERYNTDRCEQLCLPIREELTSWAWLNAPLVEEIYQRLEIGHLGLNDRGEDIWMPIFAVVESIGLKNSPVWRELTSLAQDLHRNPEFEQAQREHEILNTLIAACNNGHLQKTSEQIQGLLKEAGVTIDNVELGDLLKQCDGQQATARLSEFDTPRRSWKVPRAGLEREAERLQTEWNLRPNTEEVTTSTTEEEDKNEHEQ